MKSESTPFASSEGGKDPHSIRGDESNFFGVGQQRSIYTEMAPYQVSTTRTVASMIFGESSFIESRLYHYVIRDEVSNGCLMLTWLTGAIVGMLVIGRSIPLNFVWVSLLLIPLPILTMLELSVDLLRKLFVSMDLWILYILCFGLVVDGIYYCRADLRSVFWLSLIPSMFASGVVDAYPAKYRPKFGLFASSMAIILIVCWNLTLIFKWRQFGSMDDLLAVSSILHHTSDQLTLFVFCCRHLWCCIQHPDYLVMIKADVRTGHMPIEKV